MPIRPELLVRGLDGRPLPPPDLVAKLQQFDERVGLFFTKAAWAITERWPDTDPRWEWVQNGSMQREMAFDICGYLPLTCSLDEAPAYIERELRSYTLAEYTALRYAVNHWNEVVQPKMAEDAVLSGVSDDLAKYGGVDAGIVPVAEQLIVEASAAVEKSRPVKATKKPKGGDAA